MFTRHWSIVTLLAVGMSTASVFAAGTQPEAAAKVSEGPTLDPDLRLEQGRDSEMRRLMQELGIQRVESKSELSFLDGEAPAQDRRRLAPTSRVQPPDAFHPAKAPVAIPQQVRERLKAKIGNRFAAGFRGAIGRGVTSQSFPQYGGMTPPVGARWQTPTAGQYGSATYGTAGTTHSLTPGMYGSASPSSLLHGGSPSNLGAQAGSPSSYNVIGSGLTTLPGGGIAPGGPGGVGIGTGR